MADDSKYTDYFQALLWTCTSCGYVHEGGQPLMECPTCEAYKTGFIDIPQDLEAKVRQEFDGLPPNHIDCRQRRLALMDATGAVRNFRVAGRVLPSESGNHIDPSEIEG